LNLQSANEVTDEYRYPVETQWTVKSRAPGLAGQTEVTIAVHIQEVERRLKHPMLAHIPSDSKFIRKIHPLAPMMDPSRLSDPSTPLREKLLHESCVPDNRYPPSPDDHRNILRMRGQ